MFCTQKREMVIRSFQKTSIALPVDGSMGSVISIPGLSPENPYVGDCTCELQLDGSERRIGCAENSDHGCYEGDVSAVMHEDEDGELNSGGEDDEDDDAVVYAAEVEQWGTHLLWNPKQVTVSAGSWWVHQLKFPTSFKLEFRVSRSSSSHL
jgi:hypothetical protein